MRSRAKLRLRGRMSYSSIPPQTTGPTSQGAQPSGDRLALLYHLSQTFNSSLDLDEVLNRVMDEVIVATRAERGFLMLHDEQGQLAFRAARGMDQHTIQDPMFQISLSVVQGVARQGQPVLTGDAQVDPRFSMRTSVKLLGLRSILCVPLQIKQRILGTIYVDNRIQAGIFSPADLELLNAIASSAAIAIENARLYQVAVEKGRLESELQMARQVQLSLLPAEVPESQGWEFTARWLPARQVAGDYYDFIPCSNGRLGLVVADVSDKGMPAALFMALSRSIVRASMDPALSPAGTIQRANRLICQDSTSGMFITLFYALLDPPAGQVTYVNAGHNPALFFQRGKRPGQGAMSRLGRTGMAMGVDAVTPYEERSLTLNPGDFLVLYTDGVTDALDLHGQSFEMERLESVVLAHREETAQQIGDALESAIRSFTGGAPVFDDITLLIVRRSV
jgi:sigma-B regulation protein RsbU (phosphoserine phosphatase)